MGVDAYWLVRRLLSVRDSRAPRWGGDGCIYYISDLTGLPQLWRLCGGGRPDMVVPWDERVGDHRPGPGGVAFQSDRAGDERWGIYYARRDGSVDRVIGGDGVMSLLGEWGPGGVLAFTSNARDGVNFDLYLWRPGGEPSLAAELDGINVAAGWLGGRVLVVHRNTNLDSDILLVDPESGEAENLTRHDGEASNHSPIPIGGGWILYISNEGTEFSGLRALNVETGERVSLFEPGWDVEDVAYRDGRLVASLNVRGRSELVGGLLRWEEGRPVFKVQWSVKRQWVASGLHAGPGGVVFSAASASEGTEVYLASWSGGVERLTWSPKLGLERGFVEPEDFTVKSFDGLVIHGFIYTPREPAGNPPPAVVWLHGGPESQFRPGFNPLVQAILALGVAVVAPNFRGSTGYGKTFVHLDDVEKRLDAVKDVYYTVRALAEKGVIDGGRLCVVGGSYGGYLTMMSLAVYPEAWRCGVEMVGIFNLVTFIRNTSPYRRRYRIAEYGDPDRHGDVMLRLSPASHADKIRAPLMVVHGARDPRVPVSEAEAVVAELKRRGVPVEYIRLEDEGHGIAKLANRLSVYTRVLDFISRYLIGRPLLPGRRE